MTNYGHVSGIELANGLQFLGTRAGKVMHERREHPLWKHGNASRRESDRVAGTATTWLVGCSASVETQSGRTASKEATWLVGCSGSIHLIICLSSLSLQFFDFRKRLRTHAIGGDVYSLARLFHAHDVFHQVVNKNNVVETQSTLFHVLCDPIIFGPMYLTLGTSQKTPIGTWICCRIVSCLAVSFTYASVPVHAGKVAEEGHLLKDLLNWSDQTFGDHQALHARSPKLTEKAVQLCYSAFPAHHRISKTTLGTVARRLLQFGDACKLPTL